MARNENRLKPIVIQPKMATSRPAARAPMAKSVTVRSPLAESVPSSKLTEQKPAPKPAPKPEPVTEVSVQAALAEDLAP